VWKVVLYSLKGGISRPVPPVGRKETLGFEEKVKMKVRPDGGSFPVPNSPYPP